MLMTAGIDRQRRRAGEVQLQPVRAARTRRRPSIPKGKAILGPGTYLTTPALVISTGLTIFIGTAGLPHILMRFFTVPDSKAARVSVVWTISIIAIFTALVTVMGFGARAILGGGAEEAVGKGGNLAAPLLAQSLGGGEGTTGGDIALALFSAAAFATILAVVAGLVIAASGAIAHDLWANLSGREDEESERKVARIAAVGVGIAAIVGTLLVGTGFNVTVLVSMAFVFAASANFPPLILALTWRRFNTTGALVGVAFGIVASVVMIVLSPPVWPGPDSQGSPSSLTFPGLVTIPIGFLGCWLGTMLGKRDSEDERSFDELLVRSETGLGAEGGPTLKRRRPRSRRGGARARAGGVARAAAASSSASAAHLVEAEVRRGHVGQRRHVGAVWRRSRRSWLCWVVACPCWRRAAAATGPGTCAVARQQAIDVGRAEAPRQHAVDDDGVERAPDSAGHALLEVERLARSTARPGGRRRGRALRAGSSSSATTLRACEAIGPTRAISANVCGVRSMPTPWPLAGPSRTTRS